MRILNMSWFKLQKVSFAFIKFIGSYGCWFSWSRSMAMTCGRLFSITLVYTTLIFIVFCSYSGQNIQKERNQVWYAFLDSHISIWQAEVIWSLSKPPPHKKNLYELNFANQSGRWRAHRRHGASSIFQMAILDLF